MEVIKGYLKEHNMEDKVFFRGDLCDGLCDEGPVLKINGEIFRNITTDNVYEILNNFFNTKQGNI